MTVCAYCYDGQVLSCHESPRWVVEFMARICDHSPEGVQLVVEAYKELLSRDRAHLVPVMVSSFFLSITASKSHRRRRRPPPPTPPASQQLAGEQLPCSRACLIPSCSRHCSLRR
jgi:hypothetical protein